MHHSTMYGAFYSVVRLMNGWGLKYAFSSMIKGNVAVLFKCDFWYHLFMIKIHGLNLSLVNIIHSKGFFPVSCHTLF